MRRAAVSLAMHRIMKRHKVLLIRSRLQRVQEPELRLGLGGFGALFFRQWVGYSRVASTGTREAHADGSFGREAASKGVYSIV